MTTGRGWWREGNRKWSVVMWAITWAGVLSLAERITPEFAQVAIAGVSAFAIFNGVEHYVKNRRGGEQQP